MTGPRPRGFWTAGRPGQDYGLLVVGRRYRVVRAFTDFDRVSHCLTPLHGLTRLHDLILQKTPVSDGQVEALKAAIPALRRKGRVDR